MASDEERLTSQSGENSAVMSARLEQSPDTFPQYPIHRRSTDPAVRHPSCSPQGTCCRALAWPPAIGYTFE
jgi:hypothetical protein